MKILVTGGTGTVGSKVIDELLHRGVKVRALIRKQSAAKLPVGVETLVGDLLDPVSIEERPNQTNNDFGRFAYNALHEAWPCKE
jgi:uncharacterized protein YbjT (DUF2867 family)